MDELEQDILYLDGIQDRIFQMSQSLAGTYDTTEIEKERRAAIYRAGDRVSVLIISLKNLQRILRKEGMT